MAETPAPPKQRILIVDDEADFARLLQLNLERLGPYDVRTVSVPEQAVAAARQFRPALVVLDFVMPRMNGGEVLRALRADPALRQTPVLFLTAVVNRREVDDWVNEMQNEPCLAKPVTPEDLIAWMDTHLKL